MPKSKILVRDIMVKTVVSVLPETPLIKAAKMLALHNFDGMPVVDKENKLVGIITEYDFISKSSMIHIPTFQIILDNLKIFKKDKFKFENELKKISSFIVQDVMNCEPITLSPDDTLEKAIETFTNHHRVNPIPVVSDKLKVVGVISRFDILKPFHDMI